MAHAHATGAPQPSIPPLPRLIALINCCNDADGDACSQAAFRAAEHVLADFRETLCVYDRVSGASIDDPGLVPAPEFALLSPNASDRNAQAKAMRAHADTVVIALRARGDAQTALQPLRPHVGTAIEPGARAYAIVLEDGPDPLVAAPCARDISKSTRELGLNPCGSLLLAGTAAIARWSSSARMGRLRRDRSEAIDRLIGAVRAGKGIGAAAQLFGGGDELSAQDLLAAKPGYPAFAHNLLIAHLLK